MYLEILNGDKFDSMSPVYKANCQYTHESKFIYPNVETSGNTRLTFFHLYDSLLLKKTDSIGLLISPLDGSCLVGY